MATAFGWTVQQVEMQVVNLIQAGEIRGRVDSQNKVGGKCTMPTRNLIYRGPDPKSEGNGPSIGIICPSATVWKGDASG